MDSLLQNFLFRNPQYYELAYPEANDETPTMCRRMFAGFLPQPPRSILDVAGVRLYVPSIYQPRANGAPQA